MRLLKEIQSHIPLVPRPFLEIAKRINAREEEVIRSLRTMKEEGIVRQISPIYDTKAAGYDSALIAFKVSGERLKEAVALINSHPGVSHNYEREHDFNLWFTLAVPPDSELGLEGTVNLIARLSGAEEHLILRVVRTFKIGVKLDYGEISEREKPRVLEEKRVSELSPFEKEVIKITQEDIPLTPRPFRDIGELLGVGEEEVLETLRALKDKGVMRRFSAILFHRKVGFVANGMAVWKVPKEKVADVGLYLASLKSVSHCYERTTVGRWNYNLFSMIHGRCRDEVLELVEKIGDELGIREKKVLFSRSEFKKRRVRLFSEDFYEWEERYGRIHLN